jgi:hypothetical protein
MLLLDSLVESFIMFVLLEGGDHSVEAGVMNNGQSGV